MKIQLVTTFFHPITGGVESHVLYLARKLQKLGHEVEVLCSDSDKKGGHLSKSKTEHLGIKIVRFRTLLSLSYYHKLYPGLYSYLKKNKADIVHIHGFRKNEGYFAQFAKKRTNAKVVLTTHNPFPTHTRSEKQDKLIGFHDRTFGKKLSKNFDLIISLVPSEREILMEKFNVPKEKIVEIPNGVNDVFFKPGNAEAFYQEWNINPDRWDGIVVGVGRIKKEKGYQNLKSTISKLKNTLFFFAGGDDDYLDKLKAIYRNNQNVIFSEKFIPQEKLVDLYAAADIMVLPSMHEAFGIVIIEALASGVPAVVTNIGGPEEFLSEDVARLLDPTDELAWQNTIEGLLRNKETLKKMSENGKEFAKQFDWEIVAGKINDEYLKLVST